MGMNMMPRSGKSQVSNLIGGDMLGESGESGERVRRESGESGESGAICQSSVADSPTYFDTAKLKYNR